MSSKATILLLILLHCGDSEIQNSSDRLKAALKSDCILKTLHAEYTTQYQHTRPPHEQSLRLAQFQEHISTVLELRDNPAVTWDVDISFMADMTGQEKEMYRIGHNESWYEGDYETIHDNQHTEEIEDIILKRALVQGPDEFDGWRERGLLRPITEQLKGSCWAHVAAIPLETQLAAHRGSLEKLSAQELFDCGAEEGQHAVGAHPLGAWEYIQNSHHCTTEEEAPELEGPDVKGRECSYYITKTNALEGATLKKILSIQQRSVEAVKYIISAMAPIAVGAETEISGLEYFRGGGIFSPPYCGPKPDHAMVLVGYAEDYWIVMNTWPDCGENGFVKWTRTGNECYLLDRCYIPLLGFEEESTRQKRQLISDEDEDYDY